VKSEPVWCNIYRPTFPVLPCILPYKSCITFYTDIFQAIHATQYMIRELLLHSIEFISIYSWPELRLISGVYRFTRAYIFIYSSVTFGDGPVFGVQFSKSTTSVPSVKTLPFLSRAGFSRRIYRYPKLNKFGIHLYSYVNWVVTFQYTSKTIPVNSLLNRMEATAGENVFYLRQTLWKATVR